MWTVSGVTSGVVLDFLVAVFFACLGLTGGRVCWGRCTGALGMGTRGIDWAEKMKGFGGGWLQKVEVTIGRGVR